MLEHCVVLLACLGEAQSFLVGVLAGGDVDLVEVFVLVERVDADGLAEGS